MIEVMTKCRVLFLVGLMVAVGGCGSDEPDEPFGCATEKCIENVKKSAVPCVNEKDIDIRLEAIREEFRRYGGICFRCADYQRLYCREMLDGLKK